MSELSKRIIGASLAVVIIAIIFCSQSLSLQVVFFLIIATILIFEFLQLLTMFKQPRWVVIIIALFGSIWILMAVLVIAILSIHKPYLVALLFAITITCDIASYFGGKNFGRRKLAPSISPGKTVEGAVSGVVSTFIVTILPALYFFQNSHWLIISWFVVLATLFAILGDLVESWLKRNASVKDSGFLFYGHGGFLDRFDSVLFLAPLYAIGIGVLLNA